MVNNHTNQPADLPVREKCLDTRQSFVVTAPAGSGKTSLLTQRALALLAQSKYPEEVLCITFTRKAAAEMRARIMSALRECHRLSDTTPSYQAHTWRLAQSVLHKDAQQQWHLLENPSRLKITTIDGFCRSITQQLPIESRLGAELGNLDFPELTYRQAANETLQWLEKTNSPYHQPLASLIESLDGNTQKLEDLFCQLLTKRDQWLSLIIGIRDQRHLLETNTLTLVKDQLEQCSLSLNSVASDLALVADFCATQLQTEKKDSAIVKLIGIIGLPPADENHLPQWRGLLELLTTAKGQWRKKLDKSIGLPAGKNPVHVEMKARLKSIIADLQHNDELLEKFQQIALLPTPEFSDNQWQFLDNLTQVLPLLVGHLKILFGQLGAVDFIEVAQSALDALNVSETTVSDVLLKMDHRISHILVDEFQDTSHVQWQLLKQLTGGWTEDDGRTLFFVGDGMQSCYGFRGAEVGLFLEARQRGIGHLALDDLTLNTNFRSSAEIVHWVNTTFEEAFPANDDISRAAVRYNQAVAFAGASEKNERVDITTSVHCYAHTRAKETLTPREQESQHVASLVKALKDQDPNAVIAILVRSRGHLKEIQAELTAHQLKPQATEIEPLKERMAISDLMSLTRAMTYPTDDLAWFSLLRAPWCALAPSDLLRVREYLDDNDFISVLHFIQYLPTQSALPTISGPGFIKLRLLSQAINQAWATRKRKSLRIWLESIWHALGGCENLVDASDIDNSNTYWQLIEDFDDGGSIKDWQHFELALSQLYAAPAKDADPQLQIMTIHKSKGLEFDHVIIPGLDKTSRHDDKSLLVWHTTMTSLGEELLLMAPYPEIKIADNPPENNLYDFLRYESARRNYYELIRLLYVGCTRAEKSLHLMANVETTDEGEFKTPSKNSALASIWSNFSNQAIVDGDTRFSETNSNAPTHNVDSHEYIHWHKILRNARQEIFEFSEDTLLQSYRGHEFSDEDNKPETLDLDNMQSRSIGTIIHRMLEKIANTHVENWTQQTLDNHRHLIKSWLIQAGIFGIDANTALVRVITCCKRAISSERGYWLLSRHKGARSEYSLLDCAEEKHYIIDRTFIAEQNGEKARWIIDFKTTAPTVDESIKAFVNREVERYRPALENYARLFKEREKLPIRVALYFPLDDIFHEIL